MIAPLRRSLLALPFAATAASAQTSPGFEAVRGVTKARDIAQLGPLLDGTVREIMVAEGDRVREGQPVLRLDDTVQSQRIAQARSAAEAEGDVLQAEAQATEAQAQASRVSSAVGRGGAMEWELRQANARLAVARAAVQVAQDRRRLDRRRLEVELSVIEQYQIRAPFDGRVFKIDTGVGSPLSRSDRPITIADLRTLEATLYMPAAAFPYLRTGRQYELRLLAPVDREVRATLRFLDLLMDAASGRFRTVFVIENPDEAIPAGVEAMLTPAALRKES
ncbi:efflux RND transporter periplasmic adaptor subunit [Roseococcus pinisoli]|uniref:Efflux RND transporter periplasmic adaptor subunit n=1 Tax=Roseococcus pinisoli TaxID=2835040 RepID=A0ABS5Q7C5_9PROT|nr:efflux RND transporter periplasmic adaptor subunit [Roseococcus pinisoli]